MARETVLHTLEEKEERVILLGIDRQDDEREAEACLDELEELVKTAGAVTVGRMLQKRDKPHPGLYVGTGKVAELKEMVSLLEATGVVCDDELSPAQLRNLERELETKVMDRTMVILDIFAARAASSEGKIQVELAQLQYRLTRLTGMGASMSRLGGGIGTRGPGEKKLEVDRRYIKDRISELKKDLAEVKTHRSLLREQRKKKGQPVVALVGYTNAGKSTILNGLTQAGVLAEDKLFATLDTTTRVVTLPEGHDVFLTDTVGFIQKLSHHLVDAFKATLEELAYADVLLHVVDSSNPNRQTHMQVVYRTLQELGCGDTPVITVFNKVDQEVEYPLPLDQTALQTVAISAKRPEDLQKLLQVVEEVIKSFRQTMTILLPYCDGGKLGQIYGRTTVLEEEHREDGILLTITVDEEMKNRFENYMISDKF